MHSMEKVDYFSIIQKYISVDTLAYRLYIPHVVQVTARALKIAQRLGLSGDQQQFIESAGMLHDIGICKVHDPYLGCEGELPYLAHMTAGRDILIAEGLPQHARIAANHTGTGITKEIIQKQGLPLPEEDFVPETVEEEIISYADLFYTKVPEGLWVERTVEEVRKGRERFGIDDVKKFDEWVRRFEG